MDFFGEASVIDIYFCEHFKGAVLVGPLLDMTNICFNKFKEV